ncbi:hypothetical protein E2C01_081541 [Portunus trituberculatus]|uniref:Uncharacterized protein n=1 Tax=Portunus trituberculatus TaxID=210409 RepID=A0A5B7IW58_PORTR|nr:hypothetical protein [Portunus trituberculatus]
MRRLANLGNFVLNREILDQMRGRGQAAVMKPMMTVFTMALFLLPHCGLYFVVEMERLLLT